VVQKTGSTSERLREEFVLARLAVKGLPSPLAKSAPIGNSSFAEMNTQLLIDNESRERVLVGDMIRLVALAGHIFRETSNSDWGIDGEIEFKDGIGHASGRRLYVQLRSGDSHLERRRSDGEEVFTIKNERHIKYWTQHEYPVMLVIRNSSGLIRWMDVSAHLKAHGIGSRRMIFRGELVTIDSVQSHAVKWLEVTSK
jgi:hypothetical protein